MTALALVNPSTPTPWSKMDDEQKALIKQVCAGSSLNDNEFALLVEASIRSGLDVVRRQIYGLKFGGKLCVFTGIDGFRAVARRGGLAGVDDTVHTYNEEADPEHRFPLTATITIYRWAPNGEKESYTATARFREYAQMSNGRPTGNWLSKPHLMLSKCAEALAYRKAFTESLGGLYERAEFGDPDGHRAREAAGTARKLDDIVGETIDTTATEREPVEAEWITSDDVPPPEEMP